MSEQHQHNSADAESEPKSDATSTSAALLYAAPVLVFVAWALWPQQILDFAVGVGWVTQHPYGLHITYLAWCAASAFALAVGAAVWAGYRYRACRRWLLTLDGAVPDPPRWSLTVAAAAAAALVFLLVAGQLPMVGLGAAAAAGVGVLAVDGRAERFAARLRTRLVFVRLVRPLAGWTDHGEVRLHTKAWFAADVRRIVQQPQRIVVGVGQRFSESTPPQLFSRAANDAGWPGRYNFTLDRAAAELQGVFQ